MVRRRRSKIKKIARSTRRFLRRGLRGIRRAGIWRICLYTLGACLAYIGFLILLLPSGKEFIKQNPDMTSFMRNKLLESADHGELRKIKQTWVPLSRISPLLQKAVLASEDIAFVSHEGFDFFELHKAIQNSLREFEFPRGASTITQQLAKNLYLSGTRSPLRKIKEAIITVSLEKHLTKRRILEIYLNVAEWGDFIFGAEEAARFYFQKSSQDLSVREASFLAAILPSPNGAYNPKKHSSKINQKASIISRRMGIVSLP